MLSPKENLLIASCLSISTPLSSHHPPGGWPRCPLVIKWNRRTYRVTTTDGGHLPPVVVIRIVDVVVTTRALRGHTPLVNHHHHISALRHTHQNIIPVWLITRAFHFVELHLREIVYAFCFSFLSRNASTRALPQRLRGMRSTQDLVESRDLKASSI